MKLISNTSFGDFCRSKRKEFKIPLDYYQWYNKVRDNYDDFLKQPLNLGMFVPCDDDGNIIEHPIYKTNHSDECYCKECEEETKRCSDLQYQYQKAKEKVLFEGFEVVRFIEKENPCYVVSNKENEVTFHIGLYNFSKGVNFANTVEDLIHIQPILTESAIKQIGL